MLCLHESFYWWYRFLMADYTLNKLADVHLIYGEARVDCREARCLYAERFPRRRLPNHVTFQRLPMLTFCVRSSHNNTEMSPCCMRRNYNSECWPKGHQTSNPSRTASVETENLSDICHITKGFRFISSANSQSLYTELFYTLYIYLKQEHFWSWFTPFSSVTDSVASISRSEPLLSISVERLLNWGIS